MCAGSLYSYVACVAPAVSPAQARHIVHVAAIAQVCLDIGRLGRPARRLSHVRWRPGLVHPHKVADELLVPGPERLVLVEPRLAHRPKVQPHPDPGVVQLEVLPSHCRIAADAVPCRTVCRLPHTASSAVRPGRTLAAHLFDYPVRQPLSVRDRAVVHEQELLQRPVDVHACVEAGTKLANLISTTNVLQESCCAATRRVRAQPHCEGDSFLDRPLGWLDRGVGMEWASRMLGPRADRHL
mmetsp:Transcript_35995/g.90779  ORF Transcript_35995/g.90779 Transcript_35995/m.90779 type:complete len:240 (-) Transcript_35995:295-1014(-)